MMRERLKRKVSCLLAVIMLLTVMLSGSGLSIVRAEDGQQGAEPSGSQTEQTENSEYSDEIDETEYYGEDDPTAILEQEEGITATALSDTGSDGATVYLMGSTLNNWINAGYTVRVNAHQGSYDYDGWSIIWMTDSGKTMNNNPVYVAVISKTEIPNDGFATLQFQAYDNGTYKSQIEVFKSSWTNKSAFNNKVYNSDNFSWEEPDFETDTPGGDTYTVYYDAAMSKLSYEGSATNNILPTAGDTVHYYAWGDGMGSVSGMMTLTSSYSDGNNTWNDVYKADLNKQYEHILFWSGNGWTNQDCSSRTADLTIPWDTVSAPCFYGDTSDSAIYDSTARSGYWDEVYSIRNAESRKGTDVVDISSGTFTKQSGTLYVNSTFYDYYSDYELNGNNRDNYSGGNEVSQRNWVTFRQFNQALSDTYAAGKVSIPIYTGHFQPNWDDWEYRFSDISDTLRLSGYNKNNQNSFMSTNNSTMDIYANGDKYDYAAQGLVSSTLSYGTLMTSNGEIAEPHFDEAFLTGNNSKNAVLGEVYHNVAFPFTKKDIDKNGVEYWYFDSAETTLAMKQDGSTGAYYLKDVENQGWSKNVNSSSKTDGVSNTYGFFPFNEGTTAASAKNYNYGFGTKLEFTFRLTEDGTVLDKNGKPVPITFSFSGDDDVWVFIDGKLALDVGGAHGRVDGKLDFSTKKATVSKVKASAGSSREGENVTSDFTMDGANAEEHTLTMYYMERGMWESNMKISFNFPDENQLEVKKVIDKTEVNELFQDVFDNQSLFSFEIKNLATHFGTKEVPSDGEEITKQTVDLSSCTFTPAPGNTCERVEKGGSDCVHWYAGMEDKTGSYRDKRYGTITLKEEIDLSKMSYLQFEYYYDYSDTPSLSNMYLQLLDENGKVKGNVTDFLSGKTYGSVTMAGKSWVTVRIDLSKFVSEERFSGKVSKIRFGYNYPRNIYLRNFTFYPETTVSSLTGFVTKQYAIPDYGSAVSGKLEIPVGAKYSSSTGKNYVIREDGMFVLENEETVVFRDQFRRGSYIALEEITDSNLFDTFWTMYEDGHEVTAMGAGGTVTGGGGSMSWVENTTVVDGRIENPSAASDYEDDQPMANAYNGEKPSENTFVFRSYADPDGTTGTTKLKVVYTNKVKTGSLTIKKEKAYETDSLEGTYQFNLVFSNVGGLGLESEPIQYKTIELKAGEEYTISGIPLGTFYTVSEVTPEDGSTLEEVIVDGKNIMDPETKGITGVVDSEDSAVKAIFKNTKKPMVDITLTKNWKNQDGIDLTENIPASIHIQLQRKEKGNDSSVYTAVAGYENIEWTPGYEGWTYTIYGLDKQVDYTQANSPEYEYRFVELDSDGNVLSDGDILKTDSAGNYKVTYGEVTAGEATDGEATDGDVTDGEETASSHFEAAITNTLYSRTNVRIVKQDANDQQLLSGVEFKLEKLKEENGTYVVDDSFTALTRSTSAEEQIKGQIQFDDLEDGYYRLTETKAAEGYSLLKDAVTIVLDGQNGCKVDDQDYEPDENNTITITIQNRQKFSFPFTGGRGAAYMILGGLALAGAALFMYRLQIRKKGGKKSLKRL